MIVKGIYKEKANAFCVKHFCPNCRRIEFSYEVKPKNKTILTIEQRNRLLYHLGNIQKIIFEETEEE